MIVFPNAKINIGLRVLRKRKDGFHDLESVFYPVGLSDVLEILPSGPLLNDGNARISVSGLKAPGSEQNLCWQAVKMMKKRQGIPGVRLHLHKRIPMEAGLGGGSSDASFTLTALNEMFECGLDAEALEQYALEIGSDCPFFIRNCPTLVTGRGEELQPLGMSLKGYYLVLIVPPVSVSTAKAYKSVIPSESGRSLRDTALLAPVKWKGLITNQFEKPVFRKYPELSRIKAMMYDSGAVYASMSGSGSSIYGIFRERPAKGSLSYPAWIGELD